jgi:hypothetical protein
MATMSMNKVIHRAFRRDLGRFLDALAAYDAPDPSRAEALGRAWDNFDHQLTHHHESEHEIAWPVLQAIGITPQVIEQMDSEHDAMATALAETRAAMATFRGSAAVADAEAARSAMIGLQQATVTHLDHEEAEIEPAYLQHQDSAEMKDMGRKFSRAQSIGAAGTFFAWLTDGATPEEMAALKGSVPAPVLALISGVFGRGYRRDVAPVWRS